MSAARPPLVLLHAWPLDARMWRAQLPALRAEGEVHALDLPGFGNAPASDEPATMGGWAVILAADLRARGIERAAFAGCSMGGYAALSLLRIEPSMVAGIALISSRTPADSAAQQAARAEMIARIEREGAQVVVDFAVGLLGPATRASKPDVVAAVRVIAGDAQPKALIDGYRAIGSRLDSSALLAQAAIPLAIIAGADDPMLPASDAAKMAAGVPSASFTVVPDAGHISPMETPDAITDLLRAFWSSLGR